MKLNFATFTSILAACNTMGALYEIHQLIVENDFSLGIVVVNSLIDMYEKCEIINKAWGFFNKMHYVDTNREHSYGDYWLCKVM